ARGACGCGDRYQRAAEPGGRDSAVAGGGDAESIVIRLAADLRGRAESHLRHRIADSVPRGETVRRILICFLTGRRRDGQIVESARGWKQRAQFDLPNVTAW